MKRIRVIAALGPVVAAPLARLRARRDVEVELVSGAARAASSAWRRKAALVIFEMGEIEPAASGAGALDAITALRAEPSTQSLAVLLVVPEARLDLRERGFAAGASEVCFAGADGARAFEEALFHLAGIPLRSHSRRAAAIPVRVSTGGDSWSSATALNVSPGGMQLRWEQSEAPAKGRVLRVEIPFGSGENATLFCSVQGGTRAGTSLLTRVRFAGLTAAERARLDSLVAALPGPDEPEPELTPIPDDAIAELPRRFAPSRYAWALAIGVLLVLAGVAARYATRGPLEEPSRLASGH